jgi:glycosyltransferase involved in cell wall biosynthesis
MKHVNVLLVCYNQEKYIGTAVESILKQQYDGPVSVLVADDASTDGTLDLIRSYESRSPFPFIYLDASVNRGIFQNYRRAFDACPGEYVAVLEGDDYWTDAFRLQTHVDFLEAHPQCVLTINRFVNYYESTHQELPQKWNSKGEFQWINTRMLATGNLLGNLSACVFRNAALRRLKPDLFDMNTSDWMLGMALGEYGPIAKLKILQSVYRIGPKGVWSGRSKAEQLDGLLVTINRYDAYFDHRYSREFAQLKRLLYLERHLPKGVMKVLRRLHFEWIKRNLHPQN